MTAKKNPEDKLKAGRKRLFASPDAMQKEIDAYFYDEENKHTPTMSGLAYHLGFDDRHGLSKYADYPEFSTTIKKARSRVEMALEKHLFGGQVAGVIFNLKNNFDWKDRTEQEVEHSGNVTFNTIYEQKPE